MLTERKDMLEHQVEKTYLDVLETSCWMLKMRQLTDKMVQQAERLLDAVKEKE